MAPRNYGRARATGATQRVPSKVRAGTRGAHAPGGEQRRIGRNAGGLQLGTAAGEEQVRARQASRGVERQHGGAALVLSLRSEADAALIADEALEAQGEGGGLARARAGGGAAFETHGWRRRRWRRGGRSGGFELDDLLPGAHQRIGKDQQQIPG